MTGKEIVLYILQNDLEDSEFVLTDMFMSDRKAAEKFDVGIETVRLWFALGQLRGVRIDDHVLIFKSAKDPRKEDI